jgi:START domain
MEACLSELFNLFLEEKLVEANQKIRDAGNLYKENDLNFDFRNEEFVNIIKADLLLANQCLELLGDMNGWDPCKQSEDIATFTKNTDGEFLVRAEMLLKHPIFPVLALFSECELLHEWIPILDNAKVLGSPSKFRRVIQYFLKLPWPINDRDILLSAVGIPIPENKSVLIVLKSIDKSSYLGIPIPEPESIRTEMKIGCLNLHYINDNETQVSLISKCDPKLALIPTPIINYATKHGVFFFMESIRRKCDEYTGSEHEHLVNSKPEYYEEIRKRIANISS